MTASQAAQKVRNAIRKTGNNPKGKVRVINNDFITEVEVNLSTMGEDAEYDISNVINEIGDSENFAWNCY